MNEEQRLFLVQARSAFEVYQLLEKSSFHHCHALHYLQMSTELLGKANAWKKGKPGKSHKALVSFLQSLKTNSKAQSRLGYMGQNRHWQETINKIIPIAETLQKLAPALASDGPNPEYPWPSDAPTTAPVEYQFPIWQELLNTAYGRALLEFIRHLFERADEYL